MEMYIVTHWDRIVLKSEVALPAWHYQCRHVLKCKTQPRVTFFDTGMRKLFRGCGQPEVVIHWWSRNSTPIPRGVSEDLTFASAPKTMKYRMVECDMPRVYFPLRRKNIMDVLWNHHSNLLSRRIVLMLSLTPWSSPTSGKRKTNWPIEKVIDENTAASKSLKWVISLAW